MTYQRTNTLLLTHSFDECLNNRIGAKVVRLYTMRLLLYACEWTEMKEEKKITEMNEVSCASHVLEPNKSDKFTK